MSGAEMSRKCVSLSLVRTHPPHELICHQAGVTDRLRGPHTHTSPYHVTHVTFALTGTEELGQKLHYRNQHLLHKVNEAFKENLQKRLSLIALMRINKVVKL